MRFSASGRTRTCARAGTVLVAGAGVEKSRLARAGVCLPARPPVSPLSDMPAALSARPPAPGTHEAHPDAKESLFKVSQLVAQMGYLNRSGLEQIM